MIDGRDSHGRNSKRIFSDYKNESIKLREQVIIN
jgi:hypothetical protein